MDIESEELLNADASAISPREVELEAKLNKRTMLLSLFVALSLTELLVVFQLVRHAA